MLWNLSGLDDHQFDNFSRIQREMDELFGTRPARSGIRAMARDRYRSLVSSATMKTQLDVLHYFSNIIAPISASRAREVTSIRTVQAVNQKV